MVTVSESPNRELHGGRHARGANCQKGTIKYPVHGEALRFAVRRWRDRPFYPRREIRKLDAAALTGWQFQYYDIKENDLSPWLCAMPPNHLFRICAFLATRFQMHSPLQ